MDERQAKRDIAFGTIGLIWGSLMVVFGISPGVPSASSAYNAGDLGGVVFGVLLATAGFYYRRRGHQTRRNLQEERPSS
jgi:membrane associated rhomboid family serine protease